MFSLRSWCDQRVQDSLLSASYVQSPVLTAVLFRTNSPRRHFSPTYDNSIDMHVKHRVIFLFVCLFVCLPGVLLIADRFGYKPESSQKLFCNFVFSQEEKTCQGRRR